MVGEMEMNTKDAKKILKQVAVKKGVSEQEVRVEIEKAIERAKANSDPQVREQWNNMKFKGDTPTPEELLIYMVGKYGENSNVL